MGKGGEKYTIKSRTIHTLRSTLTETTFSSTLLVLGFLAFTVNNLYGALWLTWYAILYSSTFILFYKYG